MSQLNVGLTLSGNDLGIKTDDNCKIVEVVPGGSADGKLQAGDILLELNSITINNRADLDKIPLMAGSTITARVLREEPRSSMPTVSSSNDINGSEDATDVILKYDSGSKKKLGLGVTVENGVILVSKIVGGSVAEEVLYEGDIIVAINGDAPRSKEDTRSMLVKSLKSTGQATLKVRCILGAERKNDEPSVMMNSDVLEIAKRQQERLLNAKPEEQAAPRGILGRYTQLSEANEQKRLNVEQDHQSLMIGMDPVDHPLMHVKPDPNQNQQDDSRSDSQ